MNPNDDRGAVAGDPVDRPARDAPVAGPSLALAGDELEPARHLFGVQHLVSLAGD